MVIYAHQVNLVSPVVQLHSTKVTLLNRYPRCWTGSIQRSTQKLPTRNKGIISTLLYRFYLKKYAETSDEEQRYYFDSARHYIGLTAQYSLH